MARFEGLIGRLEACSSGGGPVKVQAGAPVSSSPAPSQPGPKADAPALAPGQVDLVALFREKCLAKVDKLLTNTKALNNAGVAQAVDHYLEMLKSQEAVLTVM